MKDKVKELKKAIEDLESKKDALMVLEGQFKVQHASEYREVENLKEKIETLKSEIQPLALKEFEKNNEKHLYGGVGIRVGKDKVIYTYKDSDALKFAKEKDMFLMLDKKAFEKAIPGLSVDFIEEKVVRGSVSVTFPAKIEIGE